MVCGTVQGMAHLLGYARVSTLEQNPDLQVDELTAAGCWKVWTDHGSGALGQRPQLDAVLEQLRPGDTLVVWRLDRLGRSLRHLIEVVTRLDERGVGFRSLRESIDTTTAGGRLVFHLFGALAQFEREIIRDRTVAGLTAARARGRVGGRPSKLTAEQVRQARRMYEARELTVEQIGAVLGVSRTSIYRALGKTTTPGAPSRSYVRTGPHRRAGDGDPGDGTRRCGAGAGTGRWRSGGGALAGPVALVCGGGRPVRSGARAGGGGQRPHQPEGGGGGAGPGQEQGVVRRGGGGAAAGPCRRPDQLPAGVGQPGQAGRRAARAAAVTGWLWAVRRHRWRWV